MTTWIPLGKLVLVRLHTRGSVIALSDAVRYSGLATVIAVGQEVTGLVTGDIVIINGPNGIVAHEELGEHVAVVPSAIILTKRAPTADEILSLDPETVN